jgi:hypothetical protein
MHMIIVSMFVKITYTVDPHGSSIVAIEKSYHGILEKSRHVHGERKHGAWHTAVKSYIFCAFPRRARFFRPAIYSVRDRAATRLWFRF